MRVARELLRGLGDTGSSLPSCPSLSLDNLLYREDFPGLHTQGRRGLNSSGVVSGSWRLDGVRIWKLSRTYSGEKPPSLSLLTHRLSLATRKPTRHLLAMPWILVRIGAPYESRWSTQFHLPRNYGTIFNSRFLNIIIIILRLLNSKLINHIIEFPYWSKHSQNLIKNRGIY